MCHTNEHKSDKVYFSVQVDPVPFGQKPHGTQIAGIKQRLAVQKPQTIDVRTFAQRIGVQGRTFNTAILENGSKAENWKSQQLFCIDIDNEDKNAKKGKKKQSQKPLTVEQVLKRCKEYSITPNIIYETLSSTPEWLKFRIVFIADKIYTNGAERDKVQLALMSIFPECDSSCKNRDRIFFGGKNILYIDEYTKFNGEQVIKLLPQVTKPKMSNPAQKKLSFTEKNDLAQLKKDFDFLGYIKSHFEIDSEKEEKDYIVISPCPICGHNDDFVYYKSTNSFYCFGQTGEKGGSIIDFLMYTQNISSKDAIKQIYKLSGKSLPCRKYRKSQNRQTAKCETGKIPNWWDSENKQILEDVFCDEILATQEMKCINKKLYTINGFVSEEELTKKIYDKICSYCTKDTAKRAIALLKCLKIKCYTPPLSLDIDRIHLKNGTLNIKTLEFTEEKYFCMNRLNVSYNPTAPAPQIWLKFLNDLLEKEDIRTLQEYMGYLLIPTTKAQKMLTIVGNGGEGKSRIGVVISEILGDNGSVFGEVKDLDNGSKARFARDKLVGCLAFIDDDTQLSALEKTSFLKQLVTAERPLEVERKSEQAQQVLLYSRVIVFGNGTLSALYDKSDGFYRRQIILKTKEKRKDRIDDKDLSQKLIAEKESIFLWCFEGLQRLLKNNFDFTISDSAKNNLEESRHNGCNILDFLESENDFEYCTDGEITSKDFYRAYCDWCDSNETQPFTNRTFISFLNNNANKYNLKYSNSVISKSNGKRVRGFRGAKSTKDYSTAVITYKNI